MEPVTDREKWRFRLIAEESLCVIIPTYNNASTVEDVVLRTYRYVRNIIVVNDGSTDDTADILSRLQRQTGITVVSFPSNEGKGNALVEGFRVAKTMGFRFAVTIDSDGQHYPEDIPLLIAAEEKNIDAIIIGSRNFEGKDISEGSLFANRFSNFWLCVQTGRRLPDTQTGFRLYPLHKLYGLNFITSRYESELELLVFAFWHGVKAVPVAVNVYYPPREERVSHFRPSKDFARISILNTILCFGAILYGYPLMALKWLRAFLRSLYALLFFVVCAFGVTIYTLVDFNISKRNLAEKKRRLHRLLRRYADYVSNRIPGVKFTYKNTAGETFERPSIIICNHQSHLDLMFTMQMTERMVIMTNEWVWNNPLYGRLIRYADFCPVTDGVEKTIDHVRELVAKGYSLLVFPEGTRSEDCSILHFHKGAFYLAEELNLDIIPVYLYGSGLVLPKKAKMLREGEVCIEVGERVTPDNEAYGAGFRKRARRFERIYRERLEQMQAEHINRKEEK